MELVSYAQDIKYQQTGHDYLHVMGTVPRTGGKNVFLSKNQPASMQEKDREDLMTVLNSILVNRNRVY